MAAVTGRKPSIIINNTPVKGVIRWSFRANPEKIDITSADSGQFKDYEFGRLDGEITAEILVDPTDTSLISAVGTGSGVGTGLTTPVEVEFRADATSTAPDYIWNALVVGDLDTVGLAAAAKRNLSFVHVSDVSGS